MYINPPTLGFTTRATTGRVPVTYGSGSSDWKYGECQANLQEPGIGIVPFSSPPPTKSHEMVK